MVRHHLRQHGNARQRDFRRWRSTLYITPNINFVAGEQCTATIYKDQIHDVDTDDSGPNTDTLPANYVWSFTVSTGTAPPYPPEVHLTMGNPTGATADIGQPNNYLMEKPEYALSYNRDLGRPNWVSWHLSDEWIGSLARVDTFRADPEVSPDWYRVESFDFSGTGFDRGHMTPNADRDNQTSIPINQATYLMSNMVAQAPDNNQGPWALFEGYLRTLLPANEVYIVAGPAGAGGSGSNGGSTMTVANGHVTVPAMTWKAALVLPKGDDDLSRVSCSSRTIAVIMPNVQGIWNDPWEKYLTNVDAVQNLTGYDLFSNLPKPIQACIEAGTNGNNPPLDTSAPSVVCTSADGMWHAGNIALACTATDTGSGLANAGDASFSLSTSLAAGAEDANASSNSRAVCDVAGNCTTAVVPGNMIDRKGPAITVTAPSGGASYELGQTVNASYACSDGGSGPAACTGTVANLSAIDTSTLGSKTFVIDVTDTLGNSSTLTVTYGVTKRNSSLSAPDAFGTYGGAITLSAKLTSSGFGVANEAISFTLNGSPVGMAVTNASGVALLSNVSRTGINANFYSGVVQASFAGDPAYNQAAAAGNFSVAPKLATVMADPKMRSYGTPNPPLTWTVTGLVNGDTATSLSGAPSLSTTATPVSLPDVYSISISPGILTAANYIFNFVPGTLTVLPTALSPASGNACNGAYNGSFNGNLTVTSSQTCIFYGGGAVHGNVTANGGNIQFIGVDIQGNVQGRANLKLSGATLEHDLLLNGSSSLTLSGGTVGGSIALQAGTIPFQLSSTIVKGNLTIQSLGPTSAQSMVCAANIQGNLTLQSSAAAVLIGGAGCAGPTTVKGSLTIQSMSATVNVSGNQVGGNLIEQSNTGPTGVFNNTISKSLQCSGNTSISGAGNTAAIKQGQCVPF